ncbi:hypothetical protein D3C87_1797590 [compost metagenome]
MNSSTLKPSVHQIVTTATVGMKNGMVRVSDIGSPPLNGRTMYWINPYCTSMIQFQVR